MSADLFAEFGEERSISQQQQSVPPGRPGVQHADSFAFFDGWSATTAPVPKSRRSPPVANPPSIGHTLSQVTTVSEDNDDWGDFEGGTTVESAPPAQQDPFALTAPQAPQPAHDSWNIAAATEDPFTSTSGQSFQPIETSWQKAPIVKAKKSADPSVLFDAEADFDDDDDFGAFEGTEVEKTMSPAPVASSSALVDLLGDVSVSQPTPAGTSSKQQNHVGRIVKAASPEKRGALAGFGNVSKAKQTSVVTPPIVEMDDAWDTFDDWEASIPTKTPTTSKSTPETSNTSTATGTSTTPAPILSPASTDPQPGELPPTNVPPPGVLLSLFPSLFTEAQEKLFKPMAAQTLPMRNKLLAEPATITYLQGYLMLANVAAHIIAGRKLRWKRDQHLSQGMRIGPASSKATSGMKLTGIDKGENRKEEREVSDVVRAWKEQIGRLRHVVSGANQIKAGTLDRGPDLQETMPVKTLKQSEGGIPARQPCMLCGLKREERVTAADLSTDDSFGEWWIDQVNMHRGKLMAQNTIACD
jgi:hypothetical protein